MRMSDLIEACEDDFEADLEEATVTTWGALRKKRKAANETPRGRLLMALSAADKDPKKSCPDGFSRNSKGKCQSNHSLESERASKSKKAVAQYKSMPAIGSAKKPSLVDRMKAMFKK